MKKIVLTIIILMIPVVCFSQLIPLVQQRIQRDNDDIKNINTQISSLQSQENQDQADIINATNNLLPEAQTADANNPSPKGN